jgi:uncharacterized protein YrrD
MEVKIMQFKENADVLTSDGQRVGQIHRVVINPKSKALTNLVVKKGLFFTRDKVIPVDHVDTANEEQVVLKKDAGKPDELPDFEETHYIPLDDPGTYSRRQPGYARRVTWYYPRPGSRWWGMGPYPYHPGPHFVAKTERNIPEGTVPLEEGAKVVSSNGEHVGDVERIYTEPEEHRATHLLISQGLLSKERKLIPTMWVEGVFEDEVRLSVETDFIERLPTYPVSD